MEHLYNPTGLVFSETLLNARRLRSQRLVDRRRVRALYRLKAAFILYNSRQNEPSSPTHLAAFGMAGTAGTVQTTLFIVPLRPETVSTPLQLPAQRSKGTDDEEIAGRRRLAYGIKTLAKEWQTS